MIDGFARLGFTLFLVLTGLKSEAADYSRDQARCSTLDYSSELGPVRNQGKYPYCFAYATADVIGHKAGLKSGQQVSALDVLVRTYVEYPRGPNQEKDLNAPIELRVGGTFNEAVSAYNKSGGVCLEENVPSSNRGDSKKLDNQLLSWALNFNLNGGYTAFSETPTANPCDGSPSSQQEVGKISSALNSFAHKKIAEDNDRRCGKRLKLPELAISQIKKQPHFTDFREIRTVIDELLDDHRVAGISYDACFLTKRQTDADYNEEVAKGCGRHASVIVGRQWNLKTNSCEYKVRNSWGTSCRGYVPEIKARCRSGHFYLTEDELADHLTGVSWLK